MNKTDKEDIIKAVREELLGVGEDAGNDQNRIIHCEFVMSIIRSALKGIPESTAVVETPVTSPEPVEIHTLDFDKLATFNLASIEKMVIVEALAKHKKFRKTAGFLGISERTLYRKMREYGIPQKNKRQKT